MPKRIDTRPPRNPPDPRPPSVPKKKPPTPAARKGGPKRENAGRGRKRMNTGGPVKALTEDARAKALEKVDGNVRGYNTGGQVAAMQQAQQLQGSAPAQQRGISGPQGAAPPIQYMQNPSPMPQESRISGRPPGMSKGGRVKKKK